MTDLVEIGKNIVLLILCKEKQHGVWTAVAVAAPFSCDLEAVSRLARTCTALGLYPEHLPDVVTDFITQANMDHEA